MCSIAPRVPHSSYTTKVDSFAEALMKEYQEYRWRAVESGGEVLGLSSICTYYVSLGA